MKQGRELDALVSEKVFGIEVLKVDSYTYDSVTGRNINEKKHFLMSNPTQEIPHYSTDLAVAFDLLRVFQKRKLIAQFVAEGVIQVFKSHPADSDAISVKGESDAHALCLAALKAIESA